MNGPDHYREAERLIDAAQRCDRPYSHLTYDNVIAAALAHATLAMTAATVLGTAHDYYEVGEDMTAWAKTGVLVDDPDDDYEPGDADEAMLGQPIVDVQLPESNDEPDSPERTET